VRFLTLLLAFVLIGCRASSPAETISTPIAFPTIELVPQGSIRIEVPPNGTPEMAPRMILSVRIYDEATKQAINDGNVYWIAGEERPVTDADLRARDRFGADIYLDGEEDGWLIVTAPGYVDYKEKVKYSIKTSRWLDVPVRLKRIGEGGV
jgi:hypothetical protein